jgi:hypothetical protein
VDTQRAFSISTLDTSDLTVIRCSKGEKRPAAQSAVLDLVPFGSQVELAVDYRFDPVVSKESASSVA